MEDRIVIVHGHEIYWESDIPLDELKIYHHEQIERDISIHDMKEGLMPILNGEGTISWKIVNPEADKWKKIAEELYQAMEEWKEVAGRTTIAAKEAMKLYEDARDGK
jgi:hypothetical protein